MPGARALLLWHEVPPCCMHLHIRACAACCAHFAGTCMCVHAGKHTGPVGVIPWYSCCSPWHWLRWALQTPTCMYKTGVVQAPMQYMQCILTAVVQELDCTCMSAPSCICCMSHACWPKCCFAIYKTRRNQDSCSSCRASDCLAWSTQCVNCRWKSQLV